MKLKTARIFIAMAVAAGSTGVAHADKRTARGMYLWSNSDERGFIPAECAIETRNDIRFRITNDTDGAGTEYESLLDANGKSIGKKLVKRSLVKIIDAPKAPDHEYVKVTGIPAEATGSNIADRENEGYVPSEFLDSVSGYKIQITRAPEVKGKKIEKIAGTSISIVDALLEVVTTEDAYTVYSCKNAEGKKRDYTVFNLYSGGNLEKAAAQVGIYWDETKVLANIKVMNAEEAEEYVFQRYNNDGADDSAGTQIPEGKSTSNAYPWTPTAGSATIDQPYMSGYGTMTIETRFVCTNDLTGSVYLRDENLNYLQRDGQRIMFANGTKVYRISNGKVLTDDNHSYFQVEAGKERGWLPGKYLAYQKESCPSLNIRYVCTKQDGGQLTLRAEDNLNNTVTMIDNLSQIGLDLTKTTEFNGNKFVLARVIDGGQTGYIAESYLKNTQAECPTKASTGNMDAPGGAFVQCMQNEMPIFASKSSCAQSGNCTGYKNAYDSRGKCAKWLKNGILKCGGSSSYVQCADAKDCGKPLVNAGFKKLDSNDISKAPVGAIIVYGHNSKKACSGSSTAGHIEMKLLSFDKSIALTKKRSIKASTAENNGKYVYISDYIGNNTWDKAGNPSWGPRSKTPSGKNCRPVLGIYYKE